MTSQAATTITISAKTWPSPLPACARTRSARGCAALSISSRQSRITSGLRRVSTPAAPMQKRAPRRRGTSRCSSAHRPPALAPLALVASRRRRPPRPSCRCSGGRAGRRPSASRGSSPRPGRGGAGQDDRADRGDQQQERGDLERQQELRQEQLADLAGRAEARRVAGAPSLSMRLQAGAERSRSHSSTNSAPREQRRGAAQRRAPPAGASARPRRRRRRPRTRRAPSPRPRRRRPAPRRRTRRAAAGTARPARAGGRRAPARCRTGCAA